MFFRQIINASKMRFQLRPTFFLSLPYRSFPCKYINLYLRRLAPDLGSCTTGCLQQVLQKEKKPVSKEVCLQIYIFLLPGVFETRGI